MESDERKIEQTLMEKFVAEQATDFIQLMDEGQNVHHKLDRQQKRLEAALNKLDRKLQKVAKDAEKASRDEERKKYGGSKGPPPDSTAPGVKLPKLELPRFNGDLLAWRSFWEFFESAVHKNPKAGGNRERFNYLQSCLEGPARQAIEGLSMTDGNYTIAVDLLKERFGKEDAIRQALHKELRELPKPDSTALGLRRFVQRLERLCRQLEELGDDLDSNEILFNLQAKLPLDIQNDVVKAKQETAKWNTSAFRAKLASIVDLKEEVERTIASEKPKSSAKRDAHSSPQANAKPPKASAVFSSVVRSKPKASQKCHFCQTSGHWSTDCRKHGTFELRSEKVKELQLCFKCLASGHLSNECRSTRSKCYNCDSHQHHTALCRQPKKPDPPKAKSFNESRQEGGKSSKPKAKNKPNKASPRVFAASSEPPTANEPSERSQWYSVGGIHVGQVGENGEGVGSNSLLLTKRVPVFNCSSEPEAQPRDATVFLDCGSQKSFVREDLAESLGLKAVGHKMLRISTITTKEPEEMLCSRYEIGVRLKDGDQFTKVDAYGVPRIIGSVPVVEVKPITSAHPKGHRWKLQLFSVPDVDLLIGNDHYWTFEVRKVDELKNGIKVVDSEIGHMVTGTLPSDLQLKVEAVNVAAIALEDDPIAEAVHAHETAAMASVLEEHDNEEDDYVPFVVFDHPAKRSYEVFWRLDLTGIGDDPCLNDDEIAEKQFAENVKHNGMRYQVPYLLKSPNPVFPNTRPMCKKRLNSQWHALRKEPGALEQVDAIFKTQHEKQMIEAPEGPSAGLDNCLPWLVVRTPHKTTPLRIVYDASARLKGFKSLNDQLYRGPVILPELPGLIMVMRTGEIVVQADVEKAFLNMNTREQDRDLTRFLWLKDIHKPPTDDNIIEYRFTRVVFGIICSPFLLAATIRHHLRQDGSELARELMDRIYSDNVLILANDELEAVSKAQRAREIFRGAGMNLREFKSNNALVNKNLGADEAVLCSFLGVKWNIANDCLILHLPKKQAKGELTMREVLRQLASPFDPCGLAAPALLPAKVYNQDLWKLKCDWNDRLSDELVNQWNLITDEWGKTTVEVPRRVVLLGVSRYEVHAFADAAKRACGIAVYLLSTTAENTSSYLVFGKSRLLPLEPPTVPKAELIGVFLANRALHYVEKHIKLPLERKCLWTDSQAVLSWVLTDPSNQPVFVANRVNEIQKSKDTEVGFVRTDQNPADLASRGTTLSQLKESALWFQGPWWLRAAATEWPHQPQLIRDRRSFYTEEEVTANAVQTAPVADKYVISPEGYSSYNRLLVATVGTLRAVSRWRRMVYRPASKNIAYLNRMKVGVKGGIEADEFAVARQFLVRQEQKVHPPTEEETYKWNLVKASNDVIVCHDRLQLSELSPQAKNPAFLQRDSHLLLLIILMIHQTLFHSGVQQTLAKLRQFIWFPKGRMTVRNALRKHCMVCKRKHAKTYRLPQMPSLPRDRVARHPPFESTGMDFMGPLYYRETPKHDSKKVWILLFTCLTTRAVQLELCPDMSTAAVLMAIRRFIAAQGKPRRILCDNAVQFWVASQMTGNVRWQSYGRDTFIDRDMRRSGIDWSFIPQLSPWAGGVYERMVGLVKKALRHAAGRRILLLDELHTVVKEIESLLNHRPLTYVYDDADSTILRPIDLIRPIHNEDSHVYVTESSDDDDEHNPNKTKYDKLVRLWKRSANLLNQFWRVFVREYLMALRERHQKTHKQGFTTGTAPKPGQVVLVKDDVMPRGLWKCARITKLHYSQDGEVRSVQIKNAKGNFLTRPLSLLYPMEIDSPKEADDVSEAEVLTDVLPSMRNGHEQHEVEPDVNAQDDCNDNEFEEPQLENSVIPRTNERYALRPRPKKRVAYSYYVATLLACLHFLMAGEAATVTTPSPRASVDIYQPPSSATYRRSDTYRYLGAKCAFQPGEKHPLTGRNSCVQTGYAIFNVTGKYCYKKYSCPNKHLQPAGLPLCGPKCKCPEWAANCTHYAGAAAVQESKYSNPKARQVLESLKPPICSHEWTHECSWADFKTEFEVELYDGSRHFVSSLTLAHEQYDSNDVVCSEGTARTSQITGTDQFCQVRKCSSIATNFCWMPTSGKVSLASPLGRIPIRAWAASHILVYRRNETSAMQNESATIALDISCKPYGVSVTANAPLEVLQTCAQKYCVRKFSNDSEPAHLDQEVKLPVPILAAPYFVQVTAYRQGQVFLREEKECPPVDLCKQINCRACPELWRNAHCVSISSVVTTILVIYLCIVVATVKFVVYRQRRRRYEIRRNRPRNRDIRQARPEEIVMTMVEPARVHFDPLALLGAPRTLQTSASDTEPECYESDELRTRSAPEIDWECPESTRGHYVSRQKKSRRRKMRSAVILALIATCLHRAHCCSETTTLMAQESECLKDKDGRITCTYSHSLRALASHETSELCLLLRDDTDRPAGTVHLQLLPMEIVCIKKHGFWTRPFKWVITSTKRCASAGSCQNDYCRTIGLNETVPELSAANQFPGYTRCMSSCGCWGCGCFLCSSACLFYRIHVQPTDQWRGEVYDCAWKLRLKIKATVHVGNATYVDNVILSPGERARSGSIVASLISATLPPLPSLGTRFVSQYFYMQKTAQIPISDVQAPTMECTEAEAATPFLSNCRIPKTACTDCRDADGMIKCDCPEITSPMDYLNDNSALLPKFDGPTWIRQGNGELIAESLLGSAEVQIKVQGLKVQLSEDLNVCTLQVKDFGGSRSSSQGATLRYVCTTDFGSASAHAHCRTLSFAVRCEDTEIVRTQQIFTDLARVDEQCILSCPGGETQFHLKASLHYAHREYVAGAEAEDKQVTVPFSFSEIFPFLWNTLIVPDLKVWVGLTLGIVIITVVGVFAFAWIEINGLTPPRFGALVPPAMTRALVGVLLLTKVAQAAKLEGAQELWPNGYLTASLADMSAETVSNDRPRVRAPGETDVEPFTAMNDHTKFGWELNSICDKFDEKNDLHRDCRVLTLADLEPACRDRNAGKFRVLSPLQIVLVLHVVRFGMGNNAESFYEDLLDQLDDGCPSQALGIFLRHRKKAQTRSLPNNDDIYKGIEKRYAYCKVARESLVGTDPTVDNSTKYRAITYTTMIHEIYTKEDKEDWRLLFDKFAVQLERWRACVAHPGKTCVNNATVFISDSLLAEVERALQKGYYKVQGRTTSEMVVNFNDQIVLTAPVKKLVVLFGHNDIHQKVPTDVTLTCLRQLLQIAKRYPHVETIAVLCPYIHDKLLRERWNALNDSFEEIVRAEGATPATTKNGRCLTEVFRDGFGYETLFTGSDGTLTPLGARKLINHLRDVYDVPLWRPSYEARFVRNPPALPPPPFERQQRHFKKTNLKRRNQRDNNPKFNKRQKGIGQNDERASGKPGENQQHAGTSKPRDEPSQR